MGEGGILLVNLIGVRAKRIAQEEMKIINQGITFSCGMSLRVVWSTYLQIKRLLLFHSFSMILGLTSLRSLLGSGIQ